MYPDPQRLEDITSIRGAMRQISAEAEAVVELLDERIEDGYPLFAAAICLLQISCAAPTSEHLALSQTAHRP